LTEIPFPPADLRIIRRQYGIFYRGNRAREEKNVYLCTSKKGTKNIGRIEYVLPHRNKKKKKQYRRTGFSVI
jgi:hypothetical protein